MQLYSDDIHLRSDRGIFWRPGNHDDLGLGDSGGVPNLEVCENVPAIAFRERLYEILPRGLWITANGFDCSLNEDFGHLLVDAEHNGRTIPLVKALDGFVKVRRDTNSACHVEMRLIAQGTKVSLRKR